jgi:SAM-dependent methyltransferase
MHASAFELGRLFFNFYWRQGFRRILDIGSLDINGSLRQHCPPAAEYVGIDCTAGPGVDLVLEDPYQYPFPAGHFDLIVSTSCFEHDPMFWLTFVEASRVLSPDGFLYLNAPSNGWYHAHPWDNWRFYPDAALALERWAQRSGMLIHCIESFTAAGATANFGTTVSWSLVGQTAYRRALSVMLSRSLITSERQEIPSFKIRLRTRKT